MDQYLSYYQLVLLCVGLALVAAALFVLLVLSRFEVAYMDNRVNTLEVELGRKRADKVHEGALKKLASGELAYFPYGPGFGIEHEDPYYAWDGHIERRTGIDRREKA